MKSEANGQRYRVKRKGDRIRVASNQIFIDIPRDVAVWVADELIDQMEAGENDASNHYPA